MVQLTPSASARPESVELPWLPDDGRYLLLSLLAYRRRADRSDSYEVECQFVKLNENGERLNKEYAWVPLEQLGLLRIGAIFEGRALGGHLNNLRPRQATQFRPTSICEIQERFPGSYTAVGERAIGEGGVWRSSLVGPSAYIGEDSGRRIYINISEIVRFYFGTLSLLAGSLMHSAYGEPGDGLIDRENTHAIDTDVFQIAPVSGLGDRASALQLALILNSPDLIGLWGTMMDGFIQAGARTVDFHMPAVGLSNRKYSFSFLGHSGLITESPLPDWKEKAFIAWNILTDYRPAPFSRLLIKLPYGMDEADISHVEDDQSDPITRFHTVVNPEAKLESRRRPGTVVGRGSPHYESLRRTFPGLSRVVVDYEIVRRPRRASRMVEWKDREVDALSVLKPGRDVNVGGIVYRPGTAYSSAPKSVIPTRSLFNTELAECGIYTPFARAELTYPITTFVAAFSRLMRYSSGILLGQDHLSAAVDEIMLLKPHPKWGPAARGRYFAVGRINVDGRSAYAYEMSRRRKTERISLGLIARADGEQLTLPEISTIARYAISQMSQRGMTIESRSRGIWPSQDIFTDIRSRVVLHTQKRRSPGLLAEDLDGLAFSLFEVKNSVGVAA